MNEVQKSESKTWLTEQPEYIALQNQVKALETQMKILVEIANPVSYREAHDRLKRYGHI